MTTLYLVESPTGRAGRYVCKGFYGNDPQRFWTDDVDDAKSWTTRADAERFVHSTGDRSWGLKVVVVDVLDKPQAGDDRPATVWAWNVLRTHAHEGTAINLHPAGAVMFLAFAELADRALCTGNGYTSTSPFEVNELLSGVLDVSARAVRTRADQLVKLGLLVATDGNYRVPESAFEARP